MSGCDLIPRPIRLDRGHTVATAADSVEAFEQLQHTVYQPGVCDDAHRTWTTRNGTLHAIEAEHVEETEEAPIRIQRKASAFRRRLRDSPATPREIIYPTDVDAPTFAGTLLSLRREPEQTPSARCDETQRLSFSPIPEPYMFSVKGSTQAQSSSVDNEASASTTPPQKPNPKPVPLASGNPAFSGLTVRPARPLSPTIAATHARRGRSDISTNDVTAQTMLGRIPPPEVTPDRPPTPPKENTSTAHRTSLDKLPTEIVQKINLDPQQMQLVSRRFANIHHGEAVALSLASKTPAARSLDGINRSLDQLDKTVPPHLTHGPLATLGSRLNSVPLKERMNAFNALFNATNACLSPFEPLTELFRQTNNWNAQDRDACQTRLMDIEGAQGAKVVASADNVVGPNEVPEFVNSLASLPHAHQSAALGALAKQLFSLPYIQSHDYAKICEDFHHLPWPPTAASGLLRKIGWITPAAQERLTALSQGSVEG